MPDKFKVVTLRATERAQFLVWQAAHGDYCEGFVPDEGIELTEPEAGERILRMLFKSKQRPHLGPFEHPHITFAVGGYPHDVVMQMRTHRVGITFDVQSMRYTGIRIGELVKEQDIQIYHMGNPKKNILALLNEEKNFDEVFYLSPANRTYVSRNGDKVLYTEEMREEDKALALLTAKNYATRIKQGMPHERARHILSAGYRQNFTMTVNSRSLMHLLDVRGAADVQLETQDLAVKMLKEFQKWMPEIGVYYEKTRWQKSNLAP